MGEQPHRYELLAELLEYPGPDIVATAETTQAALAERYPGASAAVARFAEYVAGKDPRELEELYAHTFDLLATCCLEVGYQLFGENYQRGAFLVVMQGALKRYEMTAGTELPDHLPVMLRLLCRLREEDDPRELVDDALLPALAKMKASFGESDSVYAGVVGALADVLCIDYEITVIKPPPGPGGDANQRRTPPGLNVLNNAPRHAPGRSMA